MRMYTTKKKERKKVEEEEIVSMTNLENNWKKVVGSKGVAKRRRRDDSIRGQNSVSETGESWCKNRAPQCQVSKFPAVTGQGSASPVLRGWSQERKGQVSVWLQTVPTLSLSLSLSSSFLRLSFSSLTVSSSLTIPPSLSVTLRYLSRCMHIDHPIFVLPRLFLVSYRASASRFRQGVNGEQYLDLDLREISRNSVGTSSVPRRRNLLFRRSVTLVQLAEIEQTG